MKRLAGSDGLLGAKTVFLRCHHKELVLSGLFQPCLSVCKQLHCDLLRKLFGERIEETVILPKSKFAVFVLTEKALGLLHYIASTMRAFTQRLIYRMHKYLSIRNYPVGIKQVSYHL